MNTKELLFSFKGRIRRKTWWLAFLAVVALMCLVALLLAILLAIMFPGILSYDSASLTKSVSSARIPVLGLLFFPLFAFFYSILILWIMIALDIKRLHDCDLPGWLVLLFFIPYLGGIAMFIICGFIPGTEGDNRFGPLIE
jgi:uncharacterized membrane protein YhaH (DUF805 family)